MKKKEENVEDNNVKDSAVVGSTVLGESVLGESEDESEDEPENESNDEMKKVEIIDNPEVEFCDEEVQESNELKLMNLILENPGIPVVPLVDGEVVTDKTPGYYTGCLGESWIDDYFTVPQDTIFFKKREDEIEWTTAIFVRIEKPKK